MSRKDVAALAWSGIGLLGAGSAQAAEWLLSPSAGVSTTYVDNPRLLREGGESSAGAIGDIGASVQRRTERSQFSLQPRVRASRYSEDELLDTDERYLAAQLRYLTERAEWTGSASFTRDTTLTSELGSTGFVQTNRPHENLAVSGGATLHLSERLDAGAQVYVLDSHYPDAGNTGLVDYQYRSLSLFSTLAATELSDMTVTLQGGELDVPHQPTPTRDATLRLGWSYRPDAAWTMDLSAGPAYVDAGSATDSGVVFDVDLQRQAERWKVEANVGRNLTPTGRGVLTRRDRVVLSADRSFTERLSGRISAQLIRNRDLLRQPGIAFEEIEYGRLDLSMNWRIARHWSLTLAVGGATQSAASRDDSAETYRSSLSIVWNGQPYSL